MLICLNLVITICFLNSIQIRTKSPENNSLSNRINESQSVTCICECTKHQLKIAKHIQYKGLQGFFSF